MGRKWISEVAERRRARRTDRARALAEATDEALAVSRMATDIGERHSLDDVIAELGLTREDIDAAAKANSDG